MHVAGDIRKILHDHGVHSSTIQPEFHIAQGAPPEEHLIVRQLSPYSQLTKPPPQTNQETHCLIPCPPDQVCAPENACCRKSASYFLPHRVSYLPPALLKPPPPLVDV